MTEPEAAAPAMDPKIAELLAKIAKVKKMFNLLFIYEVAYGIILLSTPFWIAMVAVGDNAYAGFFVAPFFFGLGYAFKIVASDADFAHCKPAMRANYVAHLILVVFAIVGLCLQWIPLLLGLILIAASVVPGTLAYYLAQQMKKATAG